MGLIDWWRRRHQDPSPEPSVGPEPVPSAAPDPEPSGAPEPTPGPSPSPEPGHRHRFGWRIRKLIEAIAQLKVLFNSGTLVIVIVGIIVALVWYFAK